MSLNKFTLSFCIRIIAALLLISYHANCFAQSVIYTTQDQAILNDAKTSYEAGDYFKALQLYRTLLKSYPNDFNLLMGTSTCYFKIPDFLDKAQPLLIQAQMINPKSADLLYQLGCFHYLEGHFAEAKNYLSQFLNSSTEAHENLQAQHFLQMAVFAAQLQEKSNLASIASVGSPPNSEGEESQAMFASNAKQLYFTFKGDGCKGGLEDEMLNPSPNGDFHEDIFCSRWNGKEFTQPVALNAKVNTDEIECVDWISADGTRLIFERHGPVTGHQLLQAQLINGDWSVPVAFGPRLPNTNWIGDAWLSVSEDTLLFAANLLNGHGGKDIYLSTRQPNGAWSEPVNLGNQLNSDADECTPMLSKGADTLFFSSAQPPVVGGADLFFAIKMGKTWSNCTNMGWPANTVQTDKWIRPGFNGSSFLLDGYRKGGFGQRDLYLLTFHNDNAALNGALNYWVQVGAFKNPQKFALPLSIHEPLQLQKKCEADGITRISVSGFKTMEEATQFKQKLTEKGMKGLWINVYKNGKKLTAREISNLPKSQP